MGLHMAGLYVSINYFGKRVYFSSGHNNAFLRHGLQVRRRPNMSSYGVGGKRYNGHRAENPYMIRALARSRWLKNMGRRVRRVMENDMLPSFAWPGGYAMMYSSRDGTTVCGDCANKEANYDLSLQDWGLFQPNESDDETEYCDSCNRLFSTI